MAVEAACATGPRAAPGVPLGAATVCASRLRGARFSLLAPDAADVLGCLDAASVADVVVFVQRVAPTRGGDSGEAGVAPSAMPAMRALCAQGLPAVAVALRGVAALPSAQRNAAKKAALAALVRDAALGEPDKAFSADSATDWAAAARALAELRARPPAWRGGGRAYVVAHALGFAPGATPTPEGADEVPAGAVVGTLALEGYVRGAALHAGQLLHVQGCGDFAMLRVEAAEEPAGAAERRRPGVAGAASTSGPASSAVLSAPGGKRHLLQVENEYDDLANEQTWPTAEELEQAEREAAARRAGKRRVPKGTSAYQAPWLLYEEDEADGNAEDGSDDDAMGDEEEQSEEEELQSEPDDDDGTGRPDDMLTDGELAENETAREAAWRARAAELAERRELAEVGEAEYPDEVDTPLDRPARHRFQKYRGLKSMRTGEWDSKEMLPLEYGRIFSFRSFGQARARAQREADTLLVAEDGAPCSGGVTGANAMEAEHGPEGACVAPGRYVRLLVANVPADRAQAVIEAVCGSEGVVAVNGGGLAACREVLVGCALLNHESKACVAHFRVTKDRGVGFPLASKQVMYMRAGFRRFLTRPIFSDDGLRSDKHRYLRFMPAAGTAVASMFCPIMFPSQPLLAFVPQTAAACAAASQAVAAGGIAAAPAALLGGARAAAASGELTLALSGSLVKCDPDRIILKRINLTGYPLKVHKRKAVVRWMFHNPDDVRWFRPLELWTKHGRRGRITEPVGTHGAMKCLFDVPIMQHDTVCASLYKRMYPKFPSDWLWLL